MRSKALSSTTTRAGTSASSGSSRRASMKYGSACSTTKFFFSPWLSANRPSFSRVACEMVADYQAEVAGTL